MASDYRPIPGTDREFTGRVKRRLFGTILNSVIGEDLHSQFKIKASDGTVIDVPRGVRGYGTLKLGQSVSGNAADCTWWEDGPYGGQTRYPCVIEFN